MSEILSDQFLLILVCNGVEEAMESSLVHYYFIVTQAITGHILCWERVRLKICWSCVHPPVLGIFFCFDFDFDFDGRFLHSIHGLTSSKSPFSFDFLEIFERFWRFGCSPSIPKW